MPHKREDKVWDNLFWDYLLVYLLIANSAIPFFYLFIEFKVINLIIVLIVFLLRGKITDKFLIIYLSFFSLMVIGQIYTFKIFLYQDYLTVIIRILIAYFTIKTVTTRFFDIFRNLIYLVSVISLLFYLPAIIIPGFSNFFIIKISPLLIPPFNDLLKASLSKQIILFNFNAIEAFRNSGPFWEPGTFGAFLIIAIIINTIIKGILFEKKNLVMIVAILTTLSTTSYIALLLFIIIYFVFIQKKINSFVIVLPLLAIFITIFFELGFLQNKIISQIKEVDKYNRAGLVGNRFVSAIADMNTFVKYPLFGKGRGEIDVQLITGFNAYRSNGLFLHLASFGIIFFLFYFINLYISLFRFLSLYGYKKILSYLFLFLLMLIGFSEDYYNTPFFYALTMIHSTIPSLYLKYFKIEKIQRDYKSIQIKLNNKNLKIS